MADKSASEQIDNIIQAQADWKGEMLARLRAVIKAVDPNAVQEAVKLNKAKA